MKKIVFITFLSVLAFSSCENKNKAEKYMDKASDKAEEVSKDAEREANKVGDTLEKKGKEAKDEAKKNF